MTFCPQNVVALLILERREDISQVFFVPKQCKTSTRLQIESVELKERLTLWCFSKTGLAQMCAMYNIDRSRVKGSCASGGALR